MYNNYNYNYKYVTTIKTINHGYNLVCGCVPLSYVNTWSLYAYDINNILIYSVDNYKSNDFIHYVEFITKLRAYGFLLSPFMTVTPVCSTLRWSITIFGDYLASIWTLAFLWISTNIVKRFVKKEN